MRVLVTGATGQDGTVASFQLAADGNDVVGLVRPGADTRQLQAYVPSITLVPCDLGDFEALNHTIQDVAPDVVYCLGGVSTISESVEDPDRTARVNTGSVGVLLKALRELGRTEDRRFILASSSMIFEDSRVSPQSESTRARPIGPYAQSKWEAMQLVSEARNEYGQHASSAILFNHESPLRRPSFVTRKVTMAVARIALGMQTHIELGNMDVVRDWGWAPDYVKAMRLMAESDTPGDYIVGTGVLTSITELLRIAFECVGIRDWEPYVRSDQKFTRQQDETILSADPSRAACQLGWYPSKSFADVISEMVDFDQQRLQDPGALWPIPSFH